MTAVHCSDAERGLEIVALARRWIGTPYVHQASCRDVGTDCLGLVRGIWRDAVGAEPERPPAYTPDWAEATGDERLMAAALRHMRPVSPEDVRAGDVLLFRMLDRGPAKHAAILASCTLAPGRIIHAYSGHSVCETALSASWRRRMAGVFRFPAQA